MNDQIITAIKEEFAYSIPQGYVNREIHLTNEIVLVLDFDSININQLKWFHDINRVTPPEPKFTYSPTTNLNASIWDGDNRRDCTKDELVLILDTLNEIEE